MATRFYFDSSTTAPVSPTLQAAWNVTTGNTYGMIYPSKTAYCKTSPGTTQTSGASGAVAPRKMLTATYLSQPLVAQTINSGSTISMQIRCNRNASAGTCLLRMYLRLCNEDGTNITEIGNADSTNTINGTAANRTLTITLGSNVTVADNQRLIIEIGANYTVGTVTTLTQSIVPTFTTTISDLPVDNTNATLLLPWLEFSQTLLFRNLGIAI